MKEVTVVDDLSKIIGITSFEKMIFAIRRGDYMSVIMELRRIYASGDKSAYEKAKKALRAFTPSATFKGRRILECMLNYSGIIVLDFDKLSPEELARVKALVILSPFTVACFVSPTGNGLKVFVCVKTGPEQHLKAFLHISEYYRKLTGVEIDASGKDITRLCFVSWDPNLYYNPAAKVFDWEKEENSLFGGENQGKKEVPVLKGHEDPKGTRKGDPQGASLHREKPLSNDEIFKIYKHCRSFVEKYIPFVPGSRHSFVLKLALELRKKDVPESMTLFLIQQDYQWDDKESAQIVRDVYRFDMTKEVPVLPPSQPPTPAAPPQPTVDETKKKMRTRSARNKERVADPYDEEVIFPLMEELDELYSAGGEPALLEESPAQAKMRVKMGYSLRMVEVMLSKMFDFMHNVVNGRVLWRRKGSNEPFQPAKDHEENSLLRWLHLHDQMISVGMLHNLLTSNFSRYYNPFLEYFKNLKKVDPSIDYIGQLIATVKTEDDEYFGRCFRKWYVAYAMSLYRKKVINHTIIVLVGGQGVGKTSWFRSLVSSDLLEYLSPSATAADQKDTHLMLAECCLIILDELESLNRRDLAAFKDLVTLESVHIRRPYGRFAVRLNRYASIIASVNSTQILTDPTGSRRYLCSTVKSIDYEHHVDIDACMAQALSLGLSGFKYWFDQEEIRELSDHNEAYMAKSIEEENIETWMRPVTFAEWKDRDNLTYGKNLSLMKAADISVFLAGKARQNMGINTNNLVGKILKKLEYTRLCKHSGYYWIVRVMTDEEVFRSRNTLDDTEDTKSFEQDLNRYHNPDQFIEGQSTQDDGLPF